MSHQAWITVLAWEVWELLKMIRSGQVKIIPIGDLSNGLVIGIFNIIKNSGLIILETHQYSKQSLASRISTIKPCLLKFTESKLCQPKRGQGCQDFLNKLFVMPVQVCSSHGRIKWFHNKAFRERRHPSAPRSVNGYNRLETGLFAMHCGPKGSPLCIQHCIQLTSLSFQANRPSHS